MKRTNGLAASIGVVLKMLMLPVLLVISFGALLPASLAMAAGAILGSILMWKMLSTGRGRLLTAVISAICASVAAAVVTYALSFAKEPIFLLSSEEFRDVERIAVLGAIVCFSFLICDCVAAMFAPKG